MRSKIDRYRYSLRRITNPAIEAVSLDQAKRNARLDTSDHDETMAELIAEARRYCEERTDVCLITTQWELTMDAFPDRRWLYLPRWPIASVDSISYVQPDGSTTTLATNQVSLRRDDHGRGRIARTDFSDWPIERYTPDAVKILFTAGWQTAAEVPEQWRRAILMLTAWWFEQVSAGVVGTIINTAPLGVDDLLANAATVDDFDDFDLCGD